MRVKNLISKLPNQSDQSISTFVALEHTMIPLKSSLSNKFCYVENATAPFLRSG